MAHGLNTVLRRPTAVGCKTEGKGSGIGSRRIFAPHFKLQVLDSYRNDADCKGNQRATARKYGIHRRQIQKWLQCENNLRNSVGKVKAASLEARKCGPEVSLRSGQHRQQDDFCSDAYSQSLPEQNLMCTDANVRSPPLCFQEEPNAPLDYTMHCRSRSTSPETGAPMDLSFKRTINQISSPVPLQLRVPTPPSNQAQGEMDIWDLSVKHQKSTITENQSKPVKLFKPYLDEDYSENKLKEVPHPCCSTGSVASSPDNDIQFYNNNYITPDYTYSLHELQPKNAINYYYTINKNYICTPQCEKIPCCTAYDNTGYLQSYSPPIKHRQCYSLDFKVSAIECYYQDTVGHSNEHAVTTTFNIERDHFPKWLKREDDCVHESNNFMHVVR